MQMPDARLELFSGFNIQKGKSTKAYRDKAVQTHEQSPTGRRQKIPKQAKFLNTKRKPPKHLVIKT